MTLLGSCGGDAATPSTGGSATTPATNAPASLTLTPATITLDGLGATQQLSAIVKDKNGSTIQAAVSFASSNSSIVTVNSAGLVTATGVGTVTITATTGGVSAQAAVIVTQTPASLVRISGDAQTGGPGQQLTNPVVVQINDVRGNPIAGIAVTFAVTSGGGSLSATSATTSATGQASTIWTLGTAGTQTVSAAAASVAPPSLTFSAAQVSVFVTSVAPDTLVEGASVTVRGGGFTTVAGTAVKIDGVQAVVTAATTTQLTVTVPSYDCRPARDGGVSVSIGTETSNLAIKRIHPAAFTSVAVGGQLILPSPAGYCLQFRAATTGGENYVFGVGAAAELPSTQFPVTISATSGAAASNSIALTGRTATALARKAPSAITRSAADAASDGEWERHYSAESRLREWERSNLPSRSSVGSRVASKFPALHAPPLPVVGDTIRLGVANFANSNLCVAPISVLGRVKAVGSAGIWLTDVNNPGPDSLTDVEIRAYSDTFDLKIYANDTTAFGAPSDIDGNGRVIILMSIAVNKEQNGSIAGFVFSGDLFTSTQCPASNLGELFYGRVPDVNNASGTGAVTHASVAGQLPSLIAHEFTHDIQFSRRLVLASGTGPASWEAEGQAMVAQELVGHAVLGNGPGNNYNLAFLLGAQNRRWYKQAFDLLSAYYGYKYVTTGRNPNAPEQCSLYASTSTANIACYNFAFYGASYSFQRYLLDRFGGTYPGGPFKLTRDIISKNVLLAGRQNFQNVLGVTAAGFDSVYAQWSAMLYMDDRIANVAPELTMSSWNLFDIFTNASATNVPLLAGAQNFTSFTDARLLNGGGIAYTTLSSVTAHPALAIKVRDATGGVLASTMRPVFWISRIQ